MGGGKVTRPDFGLGQPDPGHPMTEFYTLLLEALAGAESFALPGLYARFDPPAWPIEAEEARDWCALSPAPKEGFVQILPPGRLRVLAAELRCTPAGVPAALMLTEEGRRATCAVRLLPPFLWPSDEAAPALAGRLLRFDVDPRPRRARPRRRRAPAARPPPH